MVSVGIPTYNRPDGLRRTLESITQQSYEDLEIIVSDNCSPGMASRDIVREFMQKDQRIIFVRQERNLGAVANFKYVLENAAGEYFMWASDDDIWDPNFIQDCVIELVRLGTNFVAVMTETQYFSDNGYYDFFPEGKAFYDSYFESIFDRLQHMLAYNYGNLYYSLFRKSALFMNGTSFFSAFNIASLNEIPLLLFVSSKGGWRVLPRVGIYKKTSDETYAQARWEMEGGKLPNSDGIKHFLGLPGNFKYHKLALWDIQSAIELLELDQGAKQCIRGSAKRKILRHFINIALRHKSVTK